MPFDSAVMSPRIRRCAPSFIRRSLGGLLLVAILLGASTRSCAQHRARSLSKADLEFGGEQVAQMVADRPAMASVKSTTGKTIRVDKSWFGWKWCARRFAGEATPWRVNWRSDEPLSNGDHAYSEQTGGFIRLSKTEHYGKNRGKPRPFEGLWADAVYEHLNIENSPDGLDGFVATLAGLVTKQEYMDSITRLEFRAILGRIEFYEKNWKPWCEKHAVPSDPMYYWQTHASRTYEKWIESVSRPGGYPWNPYGKRHEEVIAPFLKTQGRTAPEVSLKVGAIVVILNLADSEHPITVNRMSFKKTGAALQKHLKKRVAEAKKASRTPVGVISGHPDVDRKEFQRVKKAFLEAGADRVVVVTEFPSLGY